MYRHIANIVQMGSNIDLCYIQNRVVTKHVIKRSRCMHFMMSILDYNGIKLALIYMYQTSL